MAIIIGGVFIAICLFYYLDQKRKIRKEKWREKNRKKFEQLLDALRDTYKNKGKH